MILNQYLTAIINKDGIIGQSTKYTVKYNSYTKSIIVLITMTT